MQKDPPKKTPLGISLRRLRLQKHLTLAQLSELTAGKGKNPITSQHIDKIEMGAVKHPGTEVVARLAVALDAKVDLVRGNLILESVHPVS